MPLYPYRCTVCGHRFEKIQSFKDEPLEECPECGGKLERPLTAPGLQFKGAGWYVTDYASKGSAPSDSAPGEKKTGASEPAAAESKPAASADKAKSAPATPAPSPPSTSTSSAT